MRQLNTYYWDDPNLTFDGKSYGELLNEDVYDIVVDYSEKYNRPIPISSLITCLRCGRRSPVYIQHDKNHFWRIGNYETRDFPEIMAHLGFKIVKPLHWKTGTPIKIGEAVTMEKS